MAMGNKSQHYNAVNCCGYQSIHPELKFEMETAEDFDSQTLPTLDFQCWVERGRILYKFFSKPMAKKTLIMKNSALGENSKIASSPRRLSEGPRIPARRSAWRRG